MQKGDIEIRDLDGSGFRCAVVMGGLVRFVGSVEQCRARAQFLMPAADDRERQAKMLLRAVH